MAPSGRDTETCLRPLGRGDPEIRRGFSELRVLTFEKQAKAEHIPGPWLGSQGGEEGGSQMERGNISHAVMKAI